jgi:hypothetical protein
MAKYLVTRVQELLVDADSAAEARKIAEDVYFRRPGFIATLVRQIRTTKLTTEKVRN